jgi:sugar phosphate isomerase/epimerase
MVHRTNRRRFLQIAGAGVAACGAGKVERVSAAQPGASAAKGAVPYQLGMASYTFRSFTLEHTLEMTKRLGLTRIVFKDFHLKLDATPAVIAETLAKVEAAGLQLYGGGVIYMKTEAEVDRAFEYAKAARMGMIVGVPNYELLDYTNRKVQQYDIRLAIHNHGPDNPLYPTPQDAYDRITKLDRRIGLCIDVGHTQRSGTDPSEAVEKCADRLYDVHVKDMTAPTVKGTAVEIGRGVIDIPKLLRTLKRINYTGTLALEHEKDGKDPLPGAAESIGYLRGVIATLG